MPTPAGLTELWLCMVGCYGHAWTSKFGELPVNDDRTLTLAGAIWQRGLIGIDDASVRRGFEEASRRASDWPPNMPAFRAMALGVPSLAQVKADLRGTDQPHERAPFTRLVTMYVDNYRFGRCDAETAERLLREAYELAMDYILRGGPMPEAPRSLTPPPAQQRNEAKPETVAACMAEIDRWLRTGPSTESTEAEGVNQ